MDTVAADMPVMDYSPVKLRLPFPAGLAWLLLGLSGFAILCLFGADWLDPQLVPPIRSTQMQIHRLQIAAYSATILATPAAVCAFIFFWTRRWRLRVSLIIIASAIVFTSDAIWAGTLLFPSFACSRRTYMDAMNNSRQVAFYAEFDRPDNDGNFAPHLAEVILRQDTDPRLIVYPHATTPWIQPSPKPDPTSWRAYAGDVDAHSDFNYLGADLKASVPELNKIILLYTKPLPAQLPGCRIVTFADTETRLIEEGDLPAVFAASNAARTKSGLPPIAIDGTPPAAR